VSWIATTLVFANVGFALVLLAGMHLFGSVASAFGYLRGDRLVPDAYTKALGVVQKGEERSTKFRLKNWSGEAVRVFGARSACTCVVVEDLPVDIPPGGEHRIAVRFRAKAKSGAISERIRLYTNMERPGPVVTVSCFVR
jgi:Protein of unknown function (DUF1573)